MSGIRESPNKGGNNSEEFLHRVLAYNGTRILFEGGYEITMEIRQVEKTAEFPHGFRYAFCLFSQGAGGKRRVRISGIDNAHAPKDKARPFDHKHSIKTGPGGAATGTKKGKSIVVDNMEVAIGTFLEGCYEKLVERGVDVDRAELRTAADGGAAGESPEADGAELGQGPTRANRKRRKHG